MNGADVDAGSTVVPCILTGVEATPAPFALPPGYTAFQGAYGISQTGFCNGQNVPGHTLIDMDGDGKPDLLVTSSCTDKTVDKSRWLLFLNSGSGFAQQPASFALPSGYTEFQGAYGISQTGFCNGQNVPGHTLIDMDGDGKPDLLVTSSCTDTTVDKQKWLLFRNTGSGFEQQPANFALPPGYTAFQGAYGISQTGFCNGQNVPGHTLIDIDGDGKPDLLVTSSCTDNTVDKSKWLLFRNTGSGFEQQPANFALPPGYTAFQGAYGISQTGFCNGQNVPGHTLIDMDGDRKPDLLVTTSCTDSAVDKSKWLLFRNTGSGFAQQPTSLALPPGYTAFQGARGTSQTGFCNGQNVPAHTLRDMDGDGKPDLLVTSSCTDKTVDKSRWLLFPNSGSGFAQQPASFALPSGYTEFQGAYGISQTGFCNGQNVPGHTLLDMDGDKKPDLLLTSSCTDSEVDKSRWLLHRAACSP